MNGERDEASRPAKLSPTREPPRPTIPHFESSQLFGDATEISIQHEHSIYRLKITRQGKLILNK